MNFFIICLNVFLLIFGVCCLSFILSFILVSSLPFSLPFRESFTAVIQRQLKTYPARETVTELAPY